MVRNGYRVCRHINRGPCKTQRYCTHQFIDRPTLIGPRPRCACETGCVGAGKGQDQVVIVGHYCLPRTPHTPIVKLNILINRQCSSFIQYNNHLGPNDAARGHHVAMSGTRCHHRIIAIIVMTINQHPFTVFYSVGNHQGVQG